MNKRIPWNKGLTKETDKRVAKSAKTYTGHKVTKATRIKISKANKGEPSWNKGKKWSLEVKHKMRLAKLGTTQSIESKIKRSKALKGKYINEKSWQWKGGISRLPYSILWTNQLKERIRVRDNFICQKCGIPELECITKLTVHHIDYNKLNCEHNNLITLCKSCNTKVNADRPYWTSYFKEKICLKI